MVVSAPDIRAWAPPCPLPPKLMLDPAGSPHTVLRARSPTAPLSVHLPVLRETHSWSGCPPITQAQCMAGVMSVIEFLDVVVKLVADVLIVNSTFLEPS